MGIRRNNKWNLFLAVLCMLLSICFIIMAIKPNESISRGVSSIVALCHFVSSVLYFYIYAQNKKDIKKD